MKKWITAAELMSKLNTDPDFVVQRARREKEHQKRVAEFLRAEAPIVEELRAAGFAVESVGSLLNPDFSGVEV